MPAEEKEPKEPAPKEIESKENPRLIDPFLGMILGAVLLASLFPARGVGAAAFHHVTTAAVVALFFLHGAKLSREAVIAGMSHWRLHIVVVFATFVLFPLLGIALRPLGLPLVGADVYDSVTFLCALPATVQSAIVFTSIAGGNVPAAICSASLSTILGVVLTPLVLSITARHGDAGGSLGLGAVKDVALELLLPFAIGQVSRIWLAETMKRQAALVSWVDRLSIVLVVYVAFSDAVVQHLWQRVAVTQLVGLALVCALLLASILTVTRVIAKALRFDLPDEIAIVFGGSKKSLASGVAMANVLYPPALVGSMVLSLMIFHQMQLMACTVLAGRYRRRTIRS